MGAKVGCRIEARGTLDMTLASFYRQNGLAHARSTRQNAPFTNFGWAKPYLDYWFNGDYDDCSY